MEACSFGISIYPFFCLFRYFYWKLNKKIMSIKVIEMLSYLVSYFFMYSFMTKLWIKICDSILNYLINATWRLALLALHFEPDISGHLGVMDQYPKSFRQLNSSSFPLKRSLQSKQVDKIEYNIKIELNLATINTISLKTEDSLLDLKKH